MPQPLISLYGGGPFDSKPRGVFQRIGLCKAFGLEQRSLSDNVDCLGSFFVSRRQKRGRRREKVRGCVQSAGVEFDSGDEGKVPPESSAAPRWTGARNLLLGLWKVCELNSSSASDGFYSGED